MFFTEKMRGSKKVYILKMLKVRFWHKSLLTNEGNCDNIAYCRLLYFKREIFGVQKCNINAISWIFEPFLSPEQKFAELFLPVKKCF
jgi:hypothetical protein